MKNSLELGINFYDYVKNNASADTQRLILSMRDKKFGFPLEFAVTQIECRRKVSRKLKSLIANERFLFPSLLAAEQSTHQCVAAYHALIAGNNNNILDMTAGLGIDALVLARAGNEVTAVELDSNRADILLHNSGIEDNLKISVVEGDSLKWLSDNSPQYHFDIIFVDPARRDSNNRRTYFFKDCLPDIVTNFDIISKAADRILIKASPIVDISQAIREIPGVSSIHVVCVKGECKEVLLVSEPSKRTLNDDIDIVAVDLMETPEIAAKAKSFFRFKMFSQEGNAPVVEQDEIFSGSFLYDPNAAVHKLNCAAVLCKTYEGLKKMSANTDLYWSKELYSDFPGRIFCIDSIPDKSELKGIAGNMYEVATRNYPLTSDQLRKKLKVRSGMNEFVFGCKIGAKAYPVLIKCTRTETEDDTETNQ